MSKPKLYGLGFSPTAQRAFGALAHKGVEYELIEVDITKKERPAEFNAVSPFGKVPVLSHDGKNIFESSVILEYIDETWPEPAMLPENAAGRAYARSWITVFNRAVVDRDGQFVHLVREQPKKVEVVQSIFPDLKKLDDELAGKTSLFLGDELSLVDVNIAPFAPLLGMWSELSGDTHYQGYKNIAAYFERLYAHPTLKNAVYTVPDDVMMGFFTAVIKEGLTVP